MCIYYVYIYIYIMAYRNPGWAGNPTRLPTNVVSNGIKAGRGAQQPRACDGSMYIYIYMYMYVYVYMYMYMYLQIYIC
jgi:hypothetical protein